jgi:hypothetical protein
MPVGNVEHAGLPRKFDGVIRNDDLDEYISYASRFSEDIGAVAAGLIAVILFPTGTYAPFDRNWLCFFKFLFLILRCPLHA